MTDNISNICSQLHNNGNKINLDGLINEGLKEDIKEFHQIEEYLSKRARASPSNLDNYKLKQFLKESGVNVPNLNLKYLKRRMWDNDDVHMVYRYLDLKIHVIGLANKLSSFIGSDGRIHPDWYCAKETTGRIICKNPPLQSLPSHLRKYIIPEDGYELVTADFVTNELRVLAKMTSDPILINDLQEGHDAHKSTAAAILRKPCKTITDEERKIGKAANFLIIYGGGAGALSKMIASKTGKQFSEEEANVLIHNYYNRYRKVMLYHYYLKDHIIEPKTIEGRVFDNLKYSKRLNYPIQASAAEGFVNVLSKILNSKPSSYKLVMAIHDSISLEVPKGQAEDAAKFLKNITETVMGKFLYPVPVFVKINNFI